ncbi:MAG: response regulator transcription factor [Treponema sp.]|nr:response regulator transcription factor [Treponema sp.]
MVTTIIITPQREDLRKIARIIRRSKNLSLLGSGRDGFDALRLVADKKPDVVIIDNNLDYIEGINLPPLFKNRSPDTAVILMAEKIDDFQLWQAVHNDVAGFIFTQRDLPLLPTILIDISQGNSYISPELAARVLSLAAVREPRKEDRTLEKIIPLPSPPPRDPLCFLSKKELKLLYYLGAGLGTKDIARSMDITQGTTRNMISTVMRKTGMQSRFQLVLFAKQYDLVPPE